MDKTSGSQGVTVVAAGIDTAKITFSVCGVDLARRTVLERTLNRTKLVEVFAKLAPCIVGLEASSGSHQLARELSNRTYPEIGVPDPHHPTSHHGNDPEKLAKMAKINSFHVSLFSDFLQRMKATPDGDGSLLDHSLVLYGSTLSDGNEHNHDPLPVILVGGASGRIKGGRHLRAAPQTPMSNLLLSILDKFGIQQNKFGDSTGKLEI